jgi:SAM-dependent methyltransferase
VKALLLRILCGRRVAPYALRWILSAHSRLYDLAGIVAVSANDGIHPKHRLLRYKEWFRDRIGHDWVVVDVGSNTGGMAAMLASKARRVYGIELVPKLVEAARRTYTAPNLEFIVADATKYEYSSCLPIDCVALSNVLEHIVDRVGFLTMLRRNLSWRDPGRRLFLIRVPTIERDWLACHKKEIGVEYRLDRTHEIEHTKAELVQELNDAGLMIESLETRFGEFYAVCSGGE